MVMMISDYDAETWLTSEAMATYYRHMSARKDAIKRGVKSPDKACDVKCIRKEYQTLIKAITHIRWEKACRKAGTGVAILPPQWDNGVQAELEAVWNGVSVEALNG